jgi:hypothetical protein
MPTTAYCLCYKLDDLGFDSQQTQEIVLFSNVLQLTMRLI